MAPLTLPAVRAWQPGALTGAAQATSTTSSALDDHMLDITRAVNTAQQTWLGDGASAAYARTQAIVTAGNRTSTALVSFGDVLTSAGNDLAAAKEAVLAAVDAAQAAGCQVSDDGTVRAPVLAAPPPGASGEDTARREATASSAAQQHAAAISAALDAAARADTDWATKIAAAAEEVRDIAGRPVVAGDTSGVSPAVAAILNGTGSLPSDPQALHDFWDDLSPQDKEALYAADPNLGNRDGIPVTDRDHVNRRHLVDLQANAQTTLDDVKSQHPEWASGPPSRVGMSMEDLMVQESAYDVWHDDLVAAQSSVDGLNAVEAALVPDPDGSSPPRFLMGVDNVDRAVIASNNPDLANNVTTSVPGTGTNLPGMVGGVGRSELMLAEARYADPTASTSVVTWFGYDAPPELPDATGSSYADNGAGDLRSFQDGLRVTHDGAPSNNVLLGHSYGTTVVGTAASGDTPMPVDDVVLVASPGAGVDTVDDFNLTGVPHDENGSHVFATAALGDPVPLFGGTGLLGPNPDGYLFGATRFSSDPDNPATAHSSYWDKGSSGLVNMGRIIVGKAPAS